MGNRKKGEEDGRIKKMDGSRQNEQVKKVERSAIAGSRSSRFKTLYVP